MYAVSHFIAKQQNAATSKVDTLFSCCIVRKEWQNRPLDKSYPILFLDALRVNCRQDGRTVNKALYVALAINVDGKKEVLGLWLADTEGAKFWAGVLTEIKNRGTEDILIACMDGLTGVPPPVVRTRSVRTTSRLTCICAFADAKRKAKLARKLH